MSDKIDQVFDLLEKVYVELQGTKADLNETRTELRETRTELKNDIKKIDITIENDIKPKIEALFEAQDIANRQIMNINKKLEEHDRRFDILDVKVDALSNKSKKHSYDIGLLKRREAHEA